MISKSFSICPSCIHFKACFLTTNKELVWSCSEYDDNQDRTNNPEQVKKESQFQLVKI